MGGDPAGDVNHDQHEFFLQQKCVDAQMVLISLPGLMNTDRLRRVRYDMGEEAYVAMTYQVQPSLLDQACMYRFVRK